MAIHATLGLATLLCSLVAGFLFAFAAVIMPGIARLDDREFLRAFQEIDGVIQRGQPLFGLVWLGSVLALVAGLAVAAGGASGFDRAMLAGATLVYVFGVQVPTLRINVPLNNALQALDVESTDREGWRRARDGFERRWNHWNRIRTILATLTVVALIVVLVRL